MSGWRTGFCDCCDSLPDCLLGYFLPCVEAGMAANNANQGTVWAALQCLFYPILMPVLRYQARKDRGIDGSVIGDVAAGWCCPCCTAIQVKREYD